MSNIFAQSSKDEPLKLSYHVLNSFVKFKPPYSVKQCETPNIIMYAGEKVREIQEYDNGDDKRGVLCLNLTT